MVMPTVVGKARSIDIHKEWGRTHSAGRWDMRVTRGCNVGLWDGASTIGWTRGRLFVSARFARNLNYSRASAPGWRGSLDAAGSACWARLRLVFR